MCELRSEGKPTNGRRGVASIELLPKAQERAINPAKHLKEIGSYLS
jgi:hypothetical protein